LKKLVLCLHFDKISDFVHIMFDKSLPGSIKSLFLYFKGKLNFDEILKYDPDYEMKTLFFASLCNLENLELKVYWLNSGRFLRNKIV
jgi:hypothetical protein